MQLCQHDRITGEMSFDVIIAKRNAEVTLLKWLLDRSGFEGVEECCFICPLSRPPRWWDLLEQQQEQHQQQEPQGSLLLLRLPGTGG